MQVYAGKTDGVRPNKQGLWVIRDTFCCMHGTRQGVTTHNCFRVCELIYFLLTKIMTLVGTVSKNKPDVQLLFFGGRQWEVCSSIFSYISDVTLVSYIPARYKTSILLSQHRDTACLDEGKDLKLEIVMHPNACKGRVDFSDKLVKGYAYTRIWCMLVM